MDNFLCLVYAFAKVKFSLCLDQAFNEIVPGCLQVIVNST